MNKKIDRSVNAKKPWQQPELTEQEFRQTQGQVPPPELPGAPEQSS